MAALNEWKAIDAAIDAVTRLVIARIERDNQEFEAPREVINRL